LKDYRKMGIGKSIVDFVISYLQKKGVEVITLDAQEHAKKFYEKFGFEQKGEVFEEVKIPHIQMWKKI